MGKINQLDKSVYNRLSAGEVVENPASIVKELAENSIDAGAKHIVVSIESGGIKSINITDDGCGIEKDDLRLAVMPHATSKISCAEDLETIATLGFRGEALASIASVSKLEIKSRFLDEEVAGFIRVNGGEIVGEGDCALNLGTSIRVESLFYNTPARFKFLKPPKGEESAVTKLIHELMIANPDVSFKYVVDGKQVCYTNGSGMDNALYAVFGDDICNNLIFFQTAEKNYTIKGYVGRPATDAIQGNRNKQVYIVNGRVFIDQNIPSVIQNAYGERLMKRTFPVAVIDIVMPFDEVDVNVHPGKKEVRFAEKKILNGMIYGAIKKALEKDEEEREEEMRLGMLLSPETKEDICFTLQRVMDVVDDGNDVMVADVSKTKIKELMKKYSVSESDLGPIKKKKERNYQIFPPEYYENDDKLFENGEPSEPYHAPPPLPKEMLLEGLPPEIIGQLARNPYSKDVSSGKKFAPAYVDEEEAVQEEETLRGIQREYQDTLISDEEENIRAQYRVVGQVFDTYIIVESEKKLFFIDQHAAHERILYDKLLEDCDKHMRAQSFVVPYYKQLSDEELEIFKSNEENLWTLGFDIIVQNGSLEIVSAPCILADIDLDDFVYSVLEQGGEIRHLKDLSKVKARFARIACRSAIKGGMRLSQEEIDYVMQYFFKENMPLQCPHGRPTIIMFAQNDVEKWFKRIV